MEILKKHNKNLEFEKDAAGAQITYDTVASKMLSKEYTDPAFYPLDIISNDTLRQTSKTYKEDNQRMMYEGKKMIIDELKKTMVKPRSDKVIRQQNLLVNTEKEVLKYEYFQKIKFGQEEDHLIYLMSNLKKNIQKTPEDERERKRHERKLKDFDSYNDFVIGKVKKAQDLLTHNKLQEVYDEITTAYKKTDKMLINYADNYRRIKQKRENDKDDERFEFLKTPEKYKQKMQKDMKKSSQKRNWRLRKANKMKREMVLMRKREIEENIEKKSLVYREKMVQKDEKRKQIQKKVKKMMVLLNLEMIFNFLHKISSEGTFWDIWWG